MTFFRVLADRQWGRAHDGFATSRPENDSCVMPPIACPACGGRTRDTRNPGFCYPAFDVSRFPARLRKTLDYVEIPLDAWQQLQNRVLAYLPYEVPVPPCNLFGPGALEMQGAFGQCYPNLDGRFMISGTALRELRAQDISDLFAVPVAVVSKRKPPDEYFELQIEHQARLCGSLDGEELEAQLHSIKAEWARKRILVCERCGREDGKLPMQITLAGSSIPDGVSLFRLAQRPWCVFCTEQFAAAAQRLGLTNVTFAPVATDGSEKAIGFAQVRHAQPELWVRKGPQTRLSSARSVMREPQRKEKPLPPPEPIQSLLATPSLKSKAAKLQALSRPCLRFQLRPASKMPIGSSHFGGQPDLPKSLRWPSRRKSQLDFLIQINLAQLARLLPGSGLPEAGWMWFFYDTENCPWGIDHEDRNGWRLLFWDGAAKVLESAQAPQWQAPGAELPLRNLSMQQADWLPDHNAPAIAKLKLSETELHGYRDALKSLRAPDGAPIHKILGWSDTIQNDMAAQCAELAGGNDWRLLLQLDSEEGAQIAWGDAGRLYCWIRDRDLKSNRFDRCWVFLQCH
jgi:uncharacterized protein YwqG